ncbi:MAG: ImmA/IrrE family metallo-endopeptidase [Victivallales bacterium]|nr:ImmA/IrrE family metallo-endopeptidase [Victivallales bacterium]
MENTFNSILLKLVRQSMGLSQKDFAEQVLDVKQAVLSKYENGVIVPSEEALQKLEQKTEYPQAFFFQAASELPSGLVFHRKRNALSSKLRERVESEVRLRALDVLTLCKENGVKSDVIERENRTPEQMAQALRKAWGLGDRPINNLIDLLERHNIVVLKFDFETDKLDAFFMPLPNGVVCIALNANEAFSADRHHFSLAHELGHAIMHKEQVQDDSLEKEADTFAAEFLYPNEAASVDFDDDMTFTRLKELKHKWRISMQAILFRWHKLGLMGDTAYRRYCIYFSSQGYRKHEPPCGVEYEMPSLMNQLMRDYMRSHPDVLESLCLSRSCFNKRYPECQLQGGLQEI